jgi:hypothetical protein
VAVAKRKNGFAYRRLPSPSTLGGNQGGARPPGPTAAVEWSVGYLPDFRLPDKALDLVDQACAAVRFWSLTPKIEEKSCGETPQARPAARRGSHFVVGREGIAAAVETAREILGNLLDDFNKRLGDRGMTVELDASALELVLRKGFSQEYGARNLERVMDRMLGTLVAEALLVSLARLRIAVDDSSGGQETLMLKLRVLKIHENLPPQGPSGVIAGHFHLAVEGSDDALDVLRAEAVLGAVLAEALAGCEWPRSVRAEADLRPWAGQAAPGRREIYRRRRNSALVDRLRAC